MPRQKFVEKRFSGEQKALVGFCNQIMDQYAAQGYDLSLRQLFYQLVSRNVLPNRPEFYKRLGILMNDARLAGLVDWSYIVDRGRPLHKGILWSGPGNAVKALSKQFKFNRWRNQPYFMEVMVEKQALEGVLLPVCNDLGIGFTANKGYTSVSALYQASRRYLKALKRGKKVVVLYLGDHDPSGVDMTRDIKERLEVFCGMPIDVRRLGLTKPQVDEFNLPPNPAKMTDARAASYVEQHGRLSWELDALPPDVLADLVIAAVARRLDKAAWDKDVEKEKSMRGDLVKAAEELDRKYREAVEKQTIEDDGDPI